MNATLLSRPNPRPFPTGSEVWIHSSFKPARRDAVADPWGRFWPLIGKIEKMHAEYDSIDTPKLPQSVINGTRRLLRSLDDEGVPPPTVMAGTCDATIVLEWHDRQGNQLFRSLDVLNDDEAEEFIEFAQGDNTLRTVEF